MLSNITESGNLWKHLKHNFFLQNLGLTYDQCNIQGSLWNLADPKKEIK